MKKKKKILKYSRDRVVLSDTMPYETPITFSNRHFYNFLNKYDIKYNKDAKNISWKKQSSVYLNDTLTQIIKILFGLSEDGNNSIIKIGDDSRKIPFLYKISHKEKDYRELAIPHPKNQIELVSFYEKYKEVIIYYCQVSPFSIRKPYSVAKFVYNNDKLHKKNKGDEDDLVERSDKEYDNLKTFFTYQRYPNIYKFYEDYKYHRAEKKYNKMFKFDIAKCFDSIYTHSISWAILNKDIVKEHLDSRKNKDNTFPAEFDNFMQSVNYGETNGIIIGPEFSRIFAELILQQIDKSVEHDLRKLDIIFKNDYEIYRYVDDFFVFYNNDGCKDEILSQYKIKLKDFKMTISDSKTHFYDKPLITEITIAKEKMVSLFSKKIVFDIEEYLEPDDYLKKLTFECNANHLITQFKILIKESKVEYKDIMNYTLAIINKRIERAVRKFETYFAMLSDAEYHGKLLPDQIKAKIKSEKDFTQFMIQVLDFTFFLYTVSPKVNSTIKLSNILSTVIKYFNGKYKFNLGNPALPNEYILNKRFSNLNKEYVFKKIFDEISLVLINNKSDKNVQIETLYLFIILRELGSDYRITNNKITEYFKMHMNSGKELYFEHEPNYFTITVLLFYIRNIPEFLEIKKAIKTQIVITVSKTVITKRTKKAELVLLLLDLIVCPFLDNNFKRKLLTLYNIPTDKQTQIINFKKEKKYWFTKWDNFNFAKELSAKKSQEVYT